MLSFMFVQGGFEGQNIATGLTDREIDVLGFMTEQLTSADSLVRTHS